MKEKKPQKTVKEETVDQEKKAKEAILPDPSIEKMTKEEALAYFKLPAWASREELDNEFWKLGKIYRSQDDQQKLVDIACAYNIANGTRDRKAKEAAEEQSAKHYFGKTKKQWGEFWHYEWWKFALGAAILIFIVTALKMYVFTPGVDFRVTSVGHISQDSTILSNYLTKNCKFKNPEISYVNVVSATDNESGEEVDPYAVQLANSMMALKPEIVAFDALTIPSYVFGESLQPLDDLYEEMKKTMTAEQLSMFEPYYYSRGQFYEDYGDQLKMYEDEVAKLTDADYVEHIYGFAITDKITQLSLGYTMHWEEDTRLIFAVNVSNGKPEKTVEILKKLFGDLDTLRQAYLEDHPFAESDD